MFGLLGLLVGQPIWYQVGCFVILAEQIEVISKGLSYSLIIKPGLCNRIRDECCNRKKIRLFGDFSIAPLW